MSSTMDSLSAPLYAVTQRNSVLALAKLRSYKKVTVAEYAGEIWFKLPIKFTQHTIPYLPCLYYQQVAGGLANANSNVPVMESLPDNLFWMPIQQWWKLHVQSNALAQYVLDQTNLRLISSDKLTKPTAMLVDLNSAIDFVRQASVLRTQSLQMAVNQQKQCWIEGALLPSIQADYFEVFGNVATPLGNTWSPRVDPSTVHASLGANKEDRVIFQREGKVDIIPSEALVPLTAANLYASREGLANES